MYANRPDSYRKVVISEIEKLSAKKLRRLLLSADDSPNDSHYLMSTSPLPHNRTMPERRVVSQYILGECCRRILRDDVEQLRGLHEVLCDDQSTATSAGMIFKYRAHQYLREGRTLNLSPLHADTSLGVGNRVPDEHTEQFTLPRMEEGLIDEDTIRNKPHTYFRPQNTNSPTVDSWTLTQDKPEGPPTLLAFLLSSVMEGCDAEVVDLDQVNKWVSEDVRRYLVIFTPKGVKPQVTVLPTSLTKELLGNCGVNGGFHVFHCQVDTVELFRQGNPQVG